MTAKPKLIAPCASKRAVQQTETAILPQDGQWPSILWYFGDE
jgi:hypothetical protein